MNRLKALEKESSYPIILNWSHYLTFALKCSKFLMMNK